MKFEDFGNTSVVYIFSVFVILSVKNVKIRINKTVFKYIQVKGH